MKKTFSWKNFDLKFLKSICYSELTNPEFRPPVETNQKELLIPFMDSIAKEPYRWFVTQYKNEIIENFLKDSPHLTTVMKELELLHYSNAKPGKAEDMLERISRYNFDIERVNMAVRRELLNAGKDYDESYLANSDSVFDNEININLELTRPSDVPMYDYQKTAIDALEKHFLEDNKQAGILVMPTGSGKTRVATRFMIESMVAKGWQVLWLAHRSMLIEQAANATYLFAGALLPTVNPQKRYFKFVCVSGEHATVKYLDKDDDVIIGTVQSMIAGPDHSNLEFLREALRNKVMIVVDEAHHTEANSYKMLLKAVKEVAGGVKLLGLTATPIRMGKGETARLMKIYDNNIIYSLPMSKLIASGQLATPKYIQVDTNIDFATTITLDEKKYIQKWGELSEETKQRMADLKERNALIVDTYMAHREEYGKTLIFALNGPHCLSLCEELQKRGVKCDYIYSLHTGNAEKINRFLKGELEVLVNIQVLTEGSDIPDIQTIFLTRPTSSDALLMQMIGRGMRGVQSGGTETVNIVDFHDIWGSFNKWLNPKFLLEAEVEEEQEKEPRQSKKMQTIPWEMLRDILEGIQTKYARLGDLAYNVVLPYGWYDVIDEDGNDAKVLVFENQLDGYKELLEKLPQLWTNYTGEDALHDYFDGFGLLPEAHDLQMLIDTYRLNKELPAFHEFAERNEIDANIVAGRMMAANVGVADSDNYISKIYEQYSDVIDSIYGDFDTYKQRVWDFIHYPRGQKPLGVRIEEIAPERISFDMTPIYDDDDLDEMAKEVVKERFNDAYGDLPAIMWTKKAYNSYYAQYNFGAEGEEPFIYVNRILNSASVPREVIKYVIYHELLHRDYPNHSKAFRAEEHKYPDWTYHDKFLDVKFQKFDFNRESAM